MGKAYPQTSEKNDDFLPQSSIFSLVQLKYPNFLWQYPNPNIHTSLRSGLISEKSYVVFVVSEAISEDQFNPSERKVNVFFVQLITHF